MSEIREWLKAIGLGQYADAFEGGEDHRATRLANAGTGSRRKTPRIRPIAGSGTSSYLLGPENLAPSPKRKVSDDSLGATKQVA